MSEPERRWAAAEARGGFGGLLASIPRWLNRPAQIAYADYKPVQLAAARRHGLAVPRTLLTNDRRDAEAFVHDVGRAVYKPLWANHLSEAGEHRLIYTNVIEPAGFDASGVDLTMHMFQEWITKNHEIRLTVVDDTFFAVAIYAGSEAAHVDWRSDYQHLTYRLTRTPEQVRARVRAMLDCLGLRFAALDFVVTPTGQWTFLESNPNGQWAWLQAETDVPIAAAIATALEKERR